MTLKDYNFDSSWTLFLDRDGVINTRIVDAYVLKREDFKFIAGVTEALKTFAGVFGKIIVVTNQQGIGRGYMTEADLEIIHAYMRDEIIKNGGRLDAIYHCPHVAETNHHDRKPNVGMAMKAKKNFPEIDFKKSVMAGDSLSDMEFGHRLGMVNILIGDDNTPALKHADIIRFWARNLLELSEMI